MSSLTWSNLNTGSQETAKKIHYGWIGVLGVVITKTVCYQRNKILECLFHNSYNEKCCSALLLFLTTLATATVGALAVSTGAGATWATAAVWEILRYYSVGVGHFNTYCLAWCSFRSSVSTRGSWERTVQTDSEPRRLRIYIETLSYHYIIIRILI